MVYRFSSRVTWVMLAAAAVGAVGLQRRVEAAASEIVLYASEAAMTRGNWAAASSSGAAGSHSMKSADKGFASANAPMASPSHYFEMTFDAPAATTYRVWLRLRAAGNSKWNDAVWVQFNDSTTTGGAAAYRIGTTSAMLVNLERCSGCGTLNWGWQNTGYWLNQATHVRFASSGKHTIRIQTREDGVEIDQVVLSPVKYLSTAPGPLVNDSTILSKSTSSSTPPAPSTGSLTPYKGSPFVLPGTVPAADFDNGGAGVAYSDGSAGNAGSAYRQTDVDLQHASIGGYNIGWTDDNEWTKYTVKVASAATYNVSLRVAAQSSNSVQVTVGSVSKTFSIPNTGGWQSWKTVTVPMALAAGQQTMTVKFSTGGVNLHSIVAAAATSPGDDDDDDVPPSNGGSGGTFRMLTWNIHHGKRKDGGYDLVGQAKFIAAQGPHVVVLQEVQTWDENQPPKLESLLEQYTGASWTRVWAPVTDNAGTEGNIVLTRLPVTSSKTFQMHASSNYDAIGPNRSVAQATVTVGGVPVHVFSTHLDYANTTYRTAQLIDLIYWLSKFSGRMIVGGDFNSTPGTYWITNMLGDFSDTWQDVTGSSSGGGTINGVRFDYLFRGKSSAAKIKPTSVKVLSTTLSDHLPVMADFTVTP
jgi:endonuclease/exonuclease/phosphatase family metal-dependent hydrolase